MRIEIHVLAWDRHTHVAGLNQLIGCTNPPDSLLHIIWTLQWKGRDGRDRMVVDFTTTTCTISAYHHKSCEFKSRLWRGVLDTTKLLYVIKFVSDLAGRWLSPGFPVSSTNKMTVTINLNIVESGVKHHNNNLSNLLCNHQKKDSYLLHIYLYVCMYAIKYENLLAYVRWWYIYNVEKSQRSTELFTLLSISFFFQWQLKVDAAVVPVLTIFCICW